MRSFQGSSVRGRCGLFRGVPLVFQQIQLCLAFSLDHGLAILDQGLLQARILHADVVLDAAVVQERPHERRARRIGQAVGREEIAVDLVVRG